MDKFPDEISELTSKLDGVTVDGEAPCLPSPFSSFDLDGVAAKIHEAKNIIVMAGAGISVSAGIPDFRSPGTGIYDNLQKYDLPDPQAIFTLDFFKENPAPFYHLAKELYPGSYRPTPTHYFIRRLQEEGKLLRMFTQNIDSLESLSGIPKEKVVAAHGNFDAAHVVTGPNEGKNVPVDEVKSAVLAGEAGWKAMVEKHEGLVKPDIVFFGEGLPRRFFELMEEDFPRCDLLLVMGTSLKVQPFASLIGRVDDDVPRVLLNREPAGIIDPEMLAMAIEAGVAPAVLRSTKAFAFDGDQQYRDVFLPGDCDATVWALARKLDWDAGLTEVIAAESKKFPANTSGKDASVAASPDVEVPDHVSGLWIGTASTAEGDDSCTTPLELVISLMSRKVAAGPITAFGCRVVVDPTGGEPQYIALHGTVDFETGKVELSSCDGKVIFNANFDESSGTPTLQGEWRDSAVSASSKIQCAIVTPSDEVFAGLFVGEATPIDSLKDEVPINPIRWALCYRTTPADGQPAVYGVGYFDDSADIPQNPVLFYTLQGHVGDGREMLKVYEPPVPSALSVQYSNMSLVRDPETGIVLTGGWVNTLEGTSGAFGAHLEVAPCFK